MKLDKHNAITLEYSIWHFVSILLIGCVVLLGMGVMLLKMAVYAYALFQAVLSGSWHVSMLVPILIIGMIAVLLIACMYAINAMLKVIKVRRIYLSNQGIWVEFFRRKHSYVLRWSDIHRIVEDGNAICVYYYHGHRYFYQQQHDECDAMQQVDNKAAHDLNKIRLSAHLRGYDVKLLMQVLQTFEIGGCSTSTKL